MELLKTDDFIEKLVFVLHKISECNNFDSTFIDKFLTNVNHEICSRINNNLHLSKLSEWILKIFQKWRQSSPTISEAVFVCKFFGVLAKYEQGFNFLVNTNAVNELNSILLPQLLENTTLKTVYISFLSGVLNHNSGYNWIKTTEQWKTACHLYHSSSNFYVEKEGHNFIKNFLFKTALHHETNQEMFQELLSPLRKYSEADIEGKYFTSISLLLLKLMQSLIKEDILSQTSFFCSKLMDILDLHSFINFLLENHKQELILDEASLLKALLVIVQNKNEENHCITKKKNYLMSFDDNPALLELFFSMLKQKNFNSLLKLAKYCQGLCGELHKEMEHDSKNRIFFVIVQLLPALIGTNSSDLSHFNQFTQKLFPLICHRSQEFCKVFVAEIRDLESKSFNLNNIAVKSILSIISSKECLSTEEAVIIFEAVLFILKSWIPDENSAVHQINYYDSGKTAINFVQNASLISAVLNCLCVLSEKFKFFSDELSENSSLVDLLCMLLSRVDLPSIMVVQVFSLIKLSILNFKLLSTNSHENCDKNNQFSCLTPLLFRCLLDPNWEVRDSCLEVVTAMAELSNSDPGASECILIDKNLFDLVVDIMEGDSESYVRASAIQALTAMIKIKLLNKFFFEMQCPQKILKLIENESEGIVRREAVLLIKELYIMLNEPFDEIVISFYKYMAYLAVNDLYWEVKVNSLVFWEAVIKRMMADHGLKNDFLNEEILSKREGKLKVYEILQKLSEMGCLHVLLTCLNDDCDLPVIKKSGEILSDLLAVIKHFEATELKNTWERVPTKRKNTILESLNSSETLSSVARKINCDALNEKTFEDFNRETPASSDAVIDGIVSEKDITLLLNVCFQKEKTVGLERKILINEIKTEAFLLKMQNFNLEKFLEDKQKWLTNTEVDLNSLLSEMSVVKMTDETNVIDCY